MGLYQKLRKIKNQLFYGRDISLLDVRGTAIPLPDPTTQLNIDGENSDLSNDPFYGDAALKRRKDCMKEKDYEFLLEHWKKLVKHLEDTNESLRVLCAAQHDTILKLQGLQTSPPTNQSNKDKSL